MSAFVLSTFAGSLAANSLDISNGGGSQKMFGWTEEQIS